MRIERVTTSEWWRRARAGERVPIMPDVPEAGFYACRAHRGGPWLPARIWIERRFGDDGDQLYEDRPFCTVNGREADAYERWPWLAGHPIGADEYRRLSAGETGLVMTVRERQAVLVKRPPVF